MTGRFADLSHRQATVDLAEYKAAGHTRVVLKATQGIGWVDPAFAARWVRAGELGLRRVAYHYGEAANSGAGDFDGFLAVVAAAGGLRPGDLLCLDIEDVDSQADIDRADTYAGEFCLRAASRGYPSGWLYTGRWYANPADIRPDDVPAGWRQLWISDYGPAADDQILLPAGWSRPQVVARQFSSTATVAGVTGPCDYSRLFQEDDMSETDVAAVNAHTDTRFDRLEAKLEGNLGAAAVGNPAAWLNAGISARLGLDRRRDLAPLLDDEASLREAIRAAGVDDASVELDDVKAAIRLLLADVRLTTEPAA